MKKSYKGVTLVEIAIVLVIIGLLLGGVLKGQELINNAKVRSIADRQNSLKVAWFAFIDRFQALPGDYVKAQQYVPGAHSGNGDGIIDERESAIAFQHLTGSGYLRCPQCTAQSTDGSNIKPRAYNSLQNNYGGVMAIFHDNQYYASGGATQPSRLMLHTGPRIPSNIISEVDRKLDDGIASEGDFVFNKYDSGGKANEPAVGECVTNDQAMQNNKSILNAADTVLYWRHATANPPIFNNCGGAVFF